MPLLRLFPATFLAISMFTVHAIAQTIPAPPKSTTITTFSLRVLAVLQQQAMQSQKADPAPLNEACATLRVYGFTLQDIKSGNLHASRYTTCTKVASSNLKEIQAPPAALKAVKAVPPSQ